MVGKGRRRRDRLAIDPVFTRRRAVIEWRALDTGAEGGEPKRALDLGGNGPRGIAGTVAAIALLEGHFFERGAAKTPAWGQKRDRLDQVGLAGAVRPNQYDRPLVGFERGRAIVAEIAQRQAADNNHQRSVISNRI